MEHTTVFGKQVGALVFEEIALTVSEFFDRYITDEGQNYEVEAKFGRFVDKNTQKRIYLPVKNTCVLEEGDWYTFQSELSMEQHREMNILLNKQVAADRERWKYKHLKTTDSIYYGPNHSKCRITRDQGTGAIIEAIDKRRIADLALYIPQAVVDVRISINIERKLTNITEASIADWRLDGVRRKDRMSYINRQIQVDLTQVIQGDAGSRGAPKHELEIELVHFNEQLTNHAETLSISFLSNIIDVARSIS